MERSGGWLDIVEEGARLQVSANGRWTIGHGRFLEEEICRLRDFKGRQVIINLGQVNQLDSTGAMLLHQAGHMLKGHGCEIGFHGISDRYVPLMAQVGDAGSPGRHLDVHSKHTGLGDLVSNVGRRSIEALREGRDLLNFLGLVTIVFWRAVRQPRRFRPKALITQIEQTGLDAMLIVGLLQFLIGVVLAYLMADQFRKFGAEVFTVNLIGLTILQEAGVLITAILLAGRSGSAFTAQIGTMRVNEEIDALQTLGMDPIEVLVLPRVLAMMITLPLLTFFADLCGLLGGALATVTALDISFPQYLRQLQEAVHVRDFLIGMVKAPVHAMIIALVGCYEGLKVERSAESVGRMTTLSVVESIVLVILATAVFAILMSVLGIR
ncbi:ABC transporter permease [Aestuariispira insulae]|uniref:Phospholipid/cholesterol/gamma-HCH transport system permease protein n=1 Tax=Aestuariispira insulae TaxID=1461337 RepID=A0A3D9HI78_9PROT|nr:ABC transporter permease [Aestuariispira insulae]RED49168.1 phospholipid/cholesterol/gamma-HCH transport system permease protein [Aestuariispira insulae]